MFYMVCKNLKQRDNIISYLKTKRIWAVFHYLSLHTSPFYKELHDGRNLKQSDSYSDTLVRLPFYFDLTHEELQYIISTLKNTPL